MLRKDEWTRITLQGRNYMNIYYSQHHLFPTHAVNRYAKKRQDAKGINHKISPARHNSATAHKNTRYKRS
jgi:hypothetical protein